MLFGAAGCGLVLDVDPRDAPRDGGGGGPGDGAAETDGRVRSDGSVMPVDATTADGDVVPVPTCGGPSALFDAFDEPSPYWVRTDEGTIEVAGTLRLTPAGGAATRAGIYSSFAYDARNDRANAQVLHVVPAAGVSTFLALIYDEANFTGIAHEGGNLTGYVVHGGAARSVSVPRPYDATSDRWWQVRGDRGSIVFETSPDGTTWTELHRAAAPYWLESVHVGIAAQTAASPSSFESAEFDNFNLDPGRVHTSYCPPGDLMDGFDTAGPSVDALHWYTTDGCSIVEGGGVLDLAGTGAPSPVCGIYTRHGYDLRSGEAWAHRAPTSTADHLVLGIGDAAGAWAWAACVFPGLHLEAPAGMAEGGSCPAPTVWRFGVTDETLAFTVSDSPTDFGTTFTVSTTGLDTKAMRVAIGVHAAGGATGTVQVTGYNTR